MVVSLGFGLALITGSAAFADSADREHGRHAVKDRHHKHVQENRQHGRPTVNRDHNTRDRRPAATRTHVAANNRAGQGRPNVRYRFANTRNDHPTAQHRHEEPRHAHPNTPARHHDAHPGHAQHGNNHHANAHQGHAHHANSQHANAHHANAHHGHAHHANGHHANAHHGNAQPASHQRHEESRRREHRRPEVMKFGEKSHQIRAMKQRLRMLGFDSGVDDGRYGETTRYAVWAFQKVNGLRMTNRIDQDTMRALRHPRRVRPLVRPKLTNRVEIDVRRQLLTIWRNGRADLTTHISTGANRSYCDNGHCGFARTPAGTFSAGTRAPGWTTSPLGTMFNSIYFNGGIAMHGSSQVPKYPASHGCIRIPIHTSKIVYAMVKSGEPVHVHGAQSKYV